MAERRLDAAWLEAPATRDVLTALGRDSARFVGGAVRDSLLGRPVTDIDLATPLPPEEVMARLERAGLKAVPVDLAHGTVTAVARSEAFQITTLRRDVETFGRHARVAFTEDWRADAARRDFTMNALYADAAGWITDYFGGITDALAGRVRFIGDPAERIREDGLRILRFFRFHAHYGAGGPDAAGLAACRAQRAMLDLLSIERVRDELLRLLDSPDPVPVLSSMEKTGVLGHILPEARMLDRLAGLVARERVLGRPDPLRRLAAFLPQDAGLLAAIGDRLRLSNAQRDRLGRLAEPAPQPHDARALRAAAYRAGTQAVIDRLMLASAETGTGTEALGAAIRQLERWAIPKFPLRGRDLQRAGLLPGPGLGRTLSRLEERWIDSDFTLSKAELLESLKAGEG